ncbi:GIN domain-containing protein [Pedobacter sp. PWIIR3]
MKTLTKTLFSVALTAVVLAGSAFSTFAATPEKASTTVATETGFNKIWVSGNVKIVLTQGNKESVSGSENFNAERTSVQRQGQTLFINSMESSPVTINITVKDLQRIEAYGNAVVTTSNKFDVQYLQLFLNQSATAKINAVTSSLYTEIKDNAVLKMSGIAHQSTIVATKMQNVNLDKFASVRPSMILPQNMVTETVAMTLAK